MAYRLRGRAGYPQDEPFAPTFHPDRLLEPTLLKKPAKIFTCSMGEFFDPKVPELWQSLVLDVIFHCPQHIFQILTKQPQNIPRWEEAEAHWPSNIWLGVSVDGKTNGMNLVSDLFEADFPFLRFVSFEPLLGPIQDLELLDCVQWVIIGAQTGPGAQQPRTEWVGDILLKANELDVPVFIKNNLDWRGNTTRPHEFPEVVRW